MAAKKRGLGRGLDALLGPFNVVGGGPVVEEILRMLPIEQIMRSRYQPRLNIRQESLQELADSIRAQGMVQPIVVRVAVAGRYELIAGERRLRASRRAGCGAPPSWHPGPGETKPWPGEHGWSGRARFSIPPSLPP